jgi:hypothetical protein
VTADCTNALRCHHCRGDSHHACLPYSPPPPPREQKPTPMIVLKPAKGDVTLATPALRCHPALTAEPSRHQARSPPGSGMLPRDTAGLTLDGSPSRHTLPSPPPAAEPIGDPRRRPCFELCVPHTDEINVAELALNNSGRNGGWNVSIAEPRSGQPQPSTVLPS